jgi:uncharacterized DUF497 family protein
VDVSYELEGITFTWNTLKAEENLQKHGVPFEIAAETFLDPLIQVAEVQHEAGEERTAVMGLTRAWQFLFVVSVVGRASIRLISAREGTRSERKRYEDG